jgi:hypothetical protein
LISVCIQLGVSAFAVQQSRSPVNAIHAYFMFKILKGLPAVCHSHSVRKVFGFD